MRPIHLFAAVLLSFPALIVGGLYVSQVGHDSQEVLPATSARPVSSANDSELSARIDALQAEVRSLRLQVAELQDAREPALASPDAVAARPRVAEETLTHLQRSAVVDVIEAERERLVAEKQAVIEEKETRRVFDRADRVAQRLGLTEHEEKLYADVLLGERDRRTELKASAREQGGGRAMKEFVKAGDAEIKAWREARTEELLGYTAAQSIRELGSDKDMRRSKDESKAKRSKKSNKKDGS